MKNSLWLSVLLFATATAGANYHITPRANASAYATFLRDDHCAIGAQQLSKKQVNHAFISQVSRDYVVIEVGVFPDAGTSLELAQDQFTLTTPQGTTLRPVESRQLAEFMAVPDGLLDRTSTSMQNPVGAGTTGSSSPIREVEAETGGAFGTRDRLPTLAREEAGVRWIQKDLDQKMLPDGTLKTPTAGYLFFRRPAKKPSSYQLHWTIGSHAVVLVVPPPK